jgi:hypothetical protein
VNGIAKGLKLAGQLARCDVVVLKQQNGAHNHLLAPGNATDGNRNWL